MSEETATAAPASIEVPAAPVESTPEAKPTRDALIKERGWSADEADKAVTRGMAEKAAPVAEPVEKKEPVAEVKEEKPQERRRGFPDHGLTPEQEEEVRKVLPPGSNANKFFSEMKRERALKQLERQERAQAEKERDELRERLKAFESAKPRMEVDEAGNEIDPDDKPLTLRQIREMREQEEKEQARQKAEVETRAQTLANVHKQQEEIIREFHPDFDDTLKLAGEIAGRDAENALDELIEDPARQKWAKKLMRDFANAAANADKIGDDDLTAAELAYEIGKLHPRYGRKQADAVTDGTQTALPEISPKKGPGSQSLTPAQLERLEQNTQRRASSASIPGSGGRRTVSPEDVTTQDLIRMPAEKRMAFKEKYPDIYARLRG